MKAIVNTKYRHPDIPQLTEIEKPTPKGNEVLIKVHAATPLFNQNKGKKQRCILRNLTKTKSIVKHLRMDNSIAFALE